MALIESPPISCECGACSDTVKHWSDCNVHAEPQGECTCDPVILEEGKTKMTHTCWGKLLPSETHDIFQCVGCRQEFSGEELRKWFVPTEIIGSGTVQNNKTSLHYDFTPALLSNEEPVILNDVGD